MFSIFLTLTFWLNISIEKIKLESDCSRLKGTIIMEHPNSLIDHFTGVLEHELFGRVPILPNNVILRGCVLRSTESMIGLVVNTGHDVKIMQSKISRTVKTSNLESMATRQILRIMILLVSLCACGTVGNVIYFEYLNVQDAWYLSDKQSLASIVVQQFFYLMLLHATFVPIGKLVSS